MLPASSPLLHNSEQQQEENSDDKNNTDLSFTPSIVTGDRLSNRSNTIRNINNTESTTFNQTNNNNTINTSPTISTNNNNNTLNNNHLGDVAISFFFPNSTLTPTTSASNNPTSLINNNTISSSSPLLPEHHHHCHNDQCQHHHHHNNKKKRVKKYSWKKILSIVVRFFIKIYKFIYLFIQSIYNYFTKKNTQQSSSTVNSYSNNNIIEVLKDFLNIDQFLLLFKDSSLQWIINHIKSFFKFFINHPQFHLKFYFLICLFLIGYSVFEIFYGVLHFGHHHHDPTSTINTEDSVINGEQIVDGINTKNIGGNIVDAEMQYFSNNYFFIGVLTLFSGFYLLHRTFMFLVDFILIYVKKFEQEKNTSIITSSKLSTVNNTNNILLLDNDEKKEESINNLLFETYSFGVWKRLRVLLRFGNSIFAVFVSLSIFSEMMQFLITNVYLNRTIIIINDNSWITIFFILLGLIFNIFTVYLFGNNKNDNPQQMNNKGIRNNSYSNLNGAFYPFGSSNTRYQMLPSNNNNNNWYSFIVERYLKTYLKKFKKLRKNLFSSFMYQILRESHLHLILLFYLNIINIIPIILYGFVHLLITLTCIVTTIYFIYPILKQNGKILLQTTPEKLVSHLSKCVREASTVVEGVLEIHSEHFWSLNTNALDEIMEDEEEYQEKDKLIATIKVRVANDKQVNPQKVLQSVRSIFCKNGAFQLKESNITIQVEKESILEKDVNNEQLVITVVDE
ncbi:hypothetical protein ABK040_008445 [Willaertia magna]